MISGTPRKVTSSNKDKVITYSNKQKFESIDLELISDGSSYGFTIAGYCPCYVESVNPNSIASDAGLRRGDLIMKVNSVTCFRGTLKSVLNLIKSSAGILTLTIHRNHGTIKHLPKISHVVDSGKKKSGLKKLFFKPSMWFSCAGNKSINILKCAFNSESNRTLEKQENPKSSQQSLTQTSTSSRCECCKQSMVKQQLSSQTPTVLNSGDTGYDSFDTLPKSKSIESLSSSEVSIETVTNTENSYSQCDLTVETKCPKEIKYSQDLMNKCNETRTQMIGKLIELEESFVADLSKSVAAFSRPLRGFFIKQNDYFTLFQNIEKILVISENFLRSMDKWSALDLYTKIGQLYAQKMSLFREAFAIYANGYFTSKSLLKELKSQSKQFRLFLNEVQTDDMTLDSLIDTPIIHLQQMLELFQNIRRFTFETKRSPSEAPHIDAVIVDLRKILSNVKPSDEELVSLIEEFEEDEDVDLTEWFMTCEESRHFKLNENISISAIDSANSDEEHSSSASSASFDSTE